MDQGGAHEEKTVFGMSGPDETSTFLQLQSAFEQGSHRRAVLYRWMLERHDKLSAMFGGNRINWISMAASFNSLGFRNANGDELKPEAVRKTWDRVKKRQASLVARRARRGMVPDIIPAKPAVIQPAAREPSIAQAVVVSEQKISSVSKSTDTSNETSTSVDDGGWADLQAEINKRSGV
jgi:hypothetical protein